MENGPYVQPISNLGIHPAVQHKLSMDYGLSPLPIQRMNNGPNVQPLSNINNGPIVQPLSNINGPNVQPLLSINNGQMVQPLQRATVGADYGHADYIVNPKYGKEQYDGLYVF